MTAIPSGSLEPVAAIGVGFSTGRSPKACWHRKDGVYSRCHSLDLLERQIRIHGQGQLLPRPRLSVRKFAASESLITPRRVLVHRWRGMNSSFNTGRAERGGNSVAVFESHGKEMMDARTFGAAEELGTVSEACRLMRVHRSTYFRLERQVDRWGEEALNLRERRKPRVPNEIGPHLEQRIVAFSLANARFGSRRISAERAREKWG